jgi:UDP-glucose 4-epimerase
MTSVLVTGGAGFIGSNIARECSRRGFTVRILDDLSLGSPDNLRDINNVKFIKGDVSDENMVSKAVKGVEYVFHQAAASSSPMFMPDPRRGVDVNLGGFLNVLESACREKVRKVVYASTSSIYGNRPIPWKESDMSLDDCPNSYAFSLLARDFFAKVFSRERGLHVVGLVYFSVYGPYEMPKGRYANIISQFIWAMKKGEIPVLFGDGSQSRDFVHVSDVVEANLLAAESKCGGEAINVGTGRSVSMKSAVEMLNQYMGLNIQPKHVPVPYAGYCYNTLADTEKAKRLLGFEAKISLERGLRSLIEFYESKP